MALADDARTRSGAEAWLRQPAVRQRPDPAPGVFEVALSLGGTVSAGAYTAGVLDFLVEALDQWEAARSRDDPVPRHRVVLQALSGTSGGGACGATLAKALAHAFAPERIAEPDALPNTESGNPLYRSWVLGFDLEQMCRVPETAQRPLAALLHPGPRSNPIDLPAGEPRSWVADPLTVIVTLTNLTGVPFRVAYTGDAAHGQGYTRHDDYARLEFFYRGASAGALCWPDATRVKAHPDADARGHPAAIERSWDEAWAWVRATSAFPVAFPVIELERPAWHYLYQPIVTPHPDGRGCVALDATVMQPAWADLRQEPTGTYRFVAADGGLLNNAPVELARRELAGVLGTNPRAAGTARRAVVHVDPLASPSSSGSARGRSLVRTAEATLKALLGHARYSTQDFVLATEPEGHSRFLIGAVRTTRGERLEGAPAVAGGAFGGFSGFFSAAYRHHDFMLGRRNCQQFLRHHFVLAGSNPSFGTFRGTEAVPIVPLVGTAAQAQPQPAWPDGRFRATDAADLLSARLNHVMALALPTAPQRLALVAVLLLPRALGARVAAWWLAKRGVGCIEVALKKHRLSR